MAHSRQACGCEWSDPGSIGVCFTLRGATAIPDGWDVHDGAGGMMWKPCAEHRYEYDRERGVPEALV